MAKRNMQMTGIGRFIIFLLVVTPLIYLGASYYTGQDGLQKIKDLFTKEHSTVSEHPSSDEAVKEVVNTPVDEVYENSELARLRDELATKEQKNKELYLENEQLKKELLDSKAELEQVKEQLEKIKKAIE